MKVLVINSGSSSLKYQLIDMDTYSLIAKGLIEKIGGDAEYTFTDRDCNKLSKTISVQDHTAAMQMVLSSLTDPDTGVLQSLSDIHAIGHRVVHGGELFSRSAVIDDKVIQAIRQYSELAPLHNPPNLTGILACQQVLSAMPQVAVFDTAFHQTMPPANYMYALPYRYYQEYGIRRYGFHGTSHRYVSLRTAQFLERDISSINMICCHLGNGSSITAIQGGRSVDTSMGFTPLEGVCMGTRTGSLDPAIVTYLMEKEELSTREMDTVLNKQSGLLGLSGISNDYREIRESAQQGNSQAGLAKDVLVKSIRNYLGAYMVELGRVDAIAFTAGIGENAWDIRESCLEGLENWGIILDREKNRQSLGVLTDLTGPGSRSRILLVPTNEELMIALETVNVLEGKDSLSLPRM